MRDDDKTLFAQWCVDSETGVQCLIDKLTNKVIMWKDKDGNLVEGSPNERN